MGGIDTSVNLPGVVDSLLSGNIDGAEGTVFSTITTADALLRSLSALDTVIETVKVALSV